MERQTKYLIRISTGRDLSFHHSHQAGNLIQFEYHQEPSAIGAALTFLPTRIWHHHRDPAYIRSEWYSILENFKQHSYC